MAATTCKVCDDRGNTEAGVAGLETLSIVRAGFALDPATATRLNVYQCSTCSQPWLVEQSEDGAILDWFEAGPF